MRWSGTGEPDVRGDAWRIWSVRLGERVRYLVLGGSFPPLSHDFYNSVTSDRSFGCVVLPIRASTELAGPRAEDEQHVCLLSHRLTGTLVRTEPPRTPSRPSARGGSRASLHYNRVPVSSRASTIVAQAARDEAILKMILFPK